jgi:hypothetical protein
MSFPSNHIDSLLRQLRQGKVNTTQNRIRFVKYGMPTRSANHINSFLINNTNVSEEFTKNITDFLSCPFLYQIGTCDFLLNDLFDYLFVTKSLNSHEVKDVISKCRNKQLSAWKHAISMRKKLSNWD